MTRGDSFGTFLEQMHKSNDPTAHIAREQRPRQTTADLTRHIAALDTENRHLRHEVAARIAERDNAQARAEWLVERVRCVRRQRSVWYRCRKWWREVGR